MKLEIVPRPAYEGRRAALQFYNPGMIAADELRIERLSSRDLAEVRGALVHLLRECVHAGASLGFLAPLADSEADEYWRSIAPQVASGWRVVIVVREGEGGGVVGSGQLVFESRSNGRHRAEVSKVLVLPSHRHRGLGSRIMGELERTARERSIRLLFLDTSEGHGGACGLYERLGYSYAGGIPEWALDPDGTPAKNAIFYKLLTP